MRIFAWWKFGNSFIWKFIIKMAERNREMSDIEIALQLAFHIENPCTVEVNGRTENIRDFYLRESQEYVLPKLTNPYAKEFLQEVIKQYS